jgi:hypothetical protein
MGSFLKNVGSDGNNATDNFKNKIYNKSNNYILGNTNVGGGQGMSIGYSGDGATIATRLYEPTRIFCGKNLVGDTLYSRHSQNVTSVDDTWANSQFPNNVNGTCVVLGFEGSGYDPRPYHQ